MSELTLVVVWLMTVVIAARTILVGLAGVIVGAFLAPFVQDRRRVRHDHLQVIKAQVLGPVRRQLEQFYLPFLEGKYGPVVAEGKYRRVLGSVSEAHVVWECALGPRRSAASRTFPYFTEPQETIELNEELQKDARRNHFAAFFSSFEVFERRVEHYECEWVLYARDLSAKIIERARLPLVKWDSLNSEKAWVDADLLAVLIVDLHLGLMVGPPLVGSDGRTLELNGRRLALADDRAAIRHLEEVLDDISRDRGTAEELVSGAQPLLQEATRLREEVNQLLLLSKLPGRCRYTKVPWLW